MSFNTYYAFYADGSAEKVEFPSDWTTEEVRQELDALEVLQG